MPHFWCSGLDDSAIQKWNRLSQSVGSQRAEKPTIPSCNQTMTNSSHCNTLQNQSHERCLSFFECNLVQTGAFWRYKLRLKFAALTWASEECAQIKIFAQK
jgi:hypothetical protein